MADLNFPSMFDTRQAMDRQVTDDAYKAGNLPLGGGMMYAASLEGDLYGQAMQNLGGMLGGKPDPRVAKQQALDDIMQRFPDPRTPEQYMEVASALRSAGLHDYAAQTVTLANEIRSSMPKADKAPDWKSQLDAWNKMSAKEKEQAIASGVYKAPPQKQLSSFAEKIAWLENNPDPTDKQLQLAGIKPTNDPFAETQAKLNWLKDNPDATERELQLLGITKNDSALAEKVALFNQWTEDGKEITTTQLSLLGIAPKDAPLFKQRIEELQNELSSGKITQKVFNEKKLELIMGGSKKGTTVNVNSGDLSPGWKKIDENYGSEYIDWTGGMAADTTGNIVKMKEVLNKLLKGEKLTGPIIGQMPDFALAFLNPDSIGSREAVESVVQRNLKAVLGAQFTEKEGERLIKRAYNPTLSGEENARRLALLIEQMESAAKSKNAQAEYFWENGTLKGYEGRLPQMADFWAALNGLVIGQKVGNLTYIGGDPGEESSYE